MLSFLDADKKTNRTQQATEDLPREAKSPSAPSFLCPFRAVNCLLAYAAFRSSSGTKSASQKLLSPKSPNHPYDLAGVAFMVASRALTHAVHSPPSAQ